MAYALTAIQLILAGIMLVAASGKILQMEQFLSALRLSHLPGVLVKAISVLVPGIELCLAAALVFSPPQFLPAVMAVATLLITAFTLWMLWVYMRGLRLRCGCFGGGSPEIGVGTITRNLFFLVLSLAGLLIATQTHSLLPGMSIWLIIASFSVGMSLVLAVAVQRALPVLILSKSKLLREQGL